jgi:hypothetical protein
MKQIRSIKIKGDLSSVSIGFEEAKEIEGDEEEDVVIKNHYSVKSKYRPHKDFTDAMKKLRKNALEVCEITVDSKSIGDWNVSGLSVAGDMEMKQSRVILTVTKTVKKTGKEISFKTPQVTMFPEKDEENRYHNAEELTKGIVKAIEEAMKYMGGKYDDSAEDQLPLFTFDDIQLVFDK